MAIEIVDLAIENGGSFHNFLLTFTRPGSPFSETELSFSNRDGD
jgi:hypothetical protein